jgi:hypothetical protein
MSAGAANADASGREGVSMSPAAVAERLRAASRASDLGPRRGILAKVGPAPSEVSARLRQVSALSALCRRLGALAPERRA